MPGDPRSLESRFVLVRGLRMHHLEGREPAPPDPVVVLVHGLGLSSRYMAPTGELLAREFRVLAPDLPGYGRSEHPDHILGLAELADSLADWMDVLGIPEAVFLGNSQGCQVAAEFALRHPARVRGLVLQGPTTDPHHRSPLQQFVRWRMNVRREPKGMAPIARQDYRRAGLRRLVMTTRAMMQDRMERKLPGVRAPTLVVRGSRDPIVPQRWAEEAAGLAPHGRLVVVPDVAHTMVFHHAAELARAVRPFLDSLRSPAAGAAVG